MRLLVSGCTQSLARAAQRWGPYLGVLLEPQGSVRCRTTTNLGLPYAADNAAYSNWDEAKFRRLLANVYGLERLWWIACPDVVADAKATVFRFDQWQETVSQHGPVAFVGQDGIENLDVPWDRFSAWFIGGSTEWKLSRASHDLVQEALRRGKLVHCGRVNSFQRLEMAYRWGCHSVDGSSFSKWGDRWIHRYAARIASFQKQPLLF